MVFGMPGMCDGEAMGDKWMRHSLTSRESMTGAIELIVESHRFCGILLPGRCDEKMPGMRMEAARCNIPANAVTGEANIPGSQECRDFLPIVLFDDVGTRASGSLSEKDLVVPECAAGVV